MYAVYRFSQQLLDVELWIFICLVAAAYFALRRRFLLSRRLLLLGLLMICVLGFTPLAKALIGPLETRYPPLMPGQELSSDAIIVLTGGIRWQPPIHSHTILGTQSLDRLICGINLLKDGSAPFLVIAGGVAQVFGRPAMEASTMKDQAVSLGIPSDAILIETHSRTTAESAVEVRRMLPNARRIVLTTSAFHLPRAVAVFKKQGFAEIIPAPCSYEVTGEEFTPMDLLPRLASMRLINMAIHEYVGMVVYKLLGKL
jgi:uncharacterized SAM-binding protein YcdF (DUF218 family)